MFLSFFFALITPLSGNCGFNPLCWISNSGYDSQGFFQGLSVWSAQLSGNESNVINAFVNIRLEKSLELQQLASEMESGNSSYSQTDFANAVNETWNSIPSVDSKLLAISEVNYTQNVNLEVLNATTFIDIQNQADIETLENITNLVNTTPAYNVIQNVIQAQEQHKALIEQQLISNQQHPIIMPENLNSTQMNFIAATQVSSYAQGSPANTTLYNVISQYPNSLNTTNLEQLHVQGININVQGMR